jgi:hypothetical protein
MIPAPATARTRAQLGEPNKKHAIARCDREIARAKAYLRLGLVSTLDGFLWLNDWRTERKMIEAEPE